jgi:cellulose synthase/poly-beta-1,6-N-acetylglucosamine synthase-like glycosyltransferase
VSPDISVIIAVYNTMPYLTRCLKSLVNQTIGVARVEVVAVDDGSTDGSGAELDRFTSEYPGVVRVIHQPNSGGPAAPRSLRRNSTLRRWRRRKVRSTSGRSTRRRVPARLRYARRR